MALAYSLPLEFRISGRFQYATGYRRQACWGAFFDSSTNAYSEIEGPTLGATLPAFSQLDLRIDKSWHIRSGKITVYLDVRNVYNRPNIQTAYSYNFDYLQSVAGSGLPILPILGVRGDL